MIKIALAGNPNSGKSTLFNALAGGKQRVGNWPGVTVERALGEISFQGQRCQITDLPGVVSLSGRTSNAVDERIARDYLLSGDVDLTINILDAANLRKSLFLTSQLLDMGLPVVVVLNMMDVAERAGIWIDVSKLSELLGCPVVPLVARGARDLSDLKKLLFDTAGLAAEGSEASENSRASEFSKNAEGSEKKSPPKAILGEMEELLTRLQDSARKEGASLSRWQALTLAEGGEVTGLPSAGDSELRLLRKQATANTMAFTRARYAWIDQLLADVARQSVRSSGLSASLDKLFLHKWLSLPLFLGALYLVFFISINVGGALIGPFEGVVGALVIGLPKELLASIGSPDWLIFVVADGLGGGVQLIAGFVPVIALLFLCLALLEDSGYMARAAFIVDRLMAALGLPGKAFIPMIVGFGCNVPAVMAGRALEREQDRLLVAIMAPFMSCGARLTVYALFVTIFFPRNGHNLVFALYLIGVLLAVLSGFIMRRFMLESGRTPLIMELPVYHRPSFRIVRRQVWQRLRGFMLRAGKVIVLAVFILNFFSAVQTDGSFDKDAGAGNSLLAETGRSLAPLFAPMGVEEENWPAVVGIFSGIFAKEVVVGTLDELYGGLAAEASPADPEPFDFWEEIRASLAGIGENLSAVSESLGDPLGLSVIASQGISDAAVQQGVTPATFSMIEQLFNGPLAAFSYMLFILLYIPCVATLGAISKEAGPFWMGYSALWSLVLAYAVATLSYQAGQLLLFPIQASLWGLAMILLLVLTAGMLILMGRREIRKKASRRIPLVHLS